MTRTQQMLLSILRSALWSDEPIEITVEQLNDVMRVAREQTVDGLVAGAIVDGKVKLTDSPLKEDAIMDLMGVIVKQKQNYVKQSAAVIELDKLFREEGIKYIVFKGTAAASCYNRPYLRTMGDIDFYIPHPYYAKAKSFIEAQWEVKIARSESEKHDTFTYKGIPFELHHSVETFGTHKHQELFDQLIDENVNKAVEHKVYNGSAFTLPPEESVLVVFKHMFNHLLIEGIGLRQVVDVAVLLNHYHDAININHFRALLKSLGYLHAFDCTVAMLYKYLGMPKAKDFSPCPGKNIRWGDRIMEMVLESGNFGRSSYKGKGKNKSRETAIHAFRHTILLSPLILTEVICFIIKRIKISLGKHLFPVKG